LVEKVEFDGAFIFKYSPRPGTPALRLGDTVPQEEKERRHRILLAAQKAVSLRKNQRWIGRTVEVLFESVSKRGENRYVGRTRAFKRVVAGSDTDLTGRLREARITGAADETLLGELVG
ncbi:MAG: TRAM domain-containing protein, partial [Candidatus Omnitrophica bacterium]|nr:TRAM domain-containing protein [Candidatus Omnitrophota bacterium]